MSSHELSQLKLGEVREAGYTTAVLPMGATEPHNYHLPYGTDHYIGNYVATRAARHANSMGGRVVCLPPLHYGYEGNMREFPLAINIQPSTLISIIRDIGHSLVDSGIQHLFLLNGHGGNELKTIIRELNRDVDVFICGANWWDCVQDVIARVCPGDGDHANEMETCAIQEIAPELVDMSLADDGHMKKPAIEEFSQWVKYSRHWISFAPSSGAGDPRGSTREAGHEMLEASIVRVGVFLAKLSQSPRVKGFPFGADSR